MLLGAAIATLGLGARGSPCGTCPSEFVETKPVLLSGTDAGADADGGADTGPATWTPDDNPPKDECDRLCGGYQNACRKIRVGDAGVPAVECSSPSMCGAGRKPRGLVASYRVGLDARARWLAELATLEEASVTAFRRLRAELRGQRAPRSLLRTVSRATADERKHARATKRLARVEGARLLAPRVEPLAGGPQDLEAIARENAIEGCVGETWGALVAAVQARDAAEPQVRALFARIARDELRHAELAFRVHAFAMARLPKGARGRVEAARAAAAARLVRAPLATAPALGPLGLPEPSEARSLARTLFASLGFLGAA
jgi:hypothetical protein